MGALRAKNISFVAVIVLILLGGWYLYGPSGGVNLTSLTGANFALFTAQFDSAANDERVLVLVSPT